MIICVDFDGTCVTHEYPYIGQEIGAAPVLKLLVEQGHKLILFTMRSDGREDSLDSGQGIEHKDVLTQAVNWFKSKDIPLFGVNTNPTQHEWTDSPKAYGNLYIDDCALGIPLIAGYGDSRPFVDWEKVKEMLYERGILQ